jgi:hypothetical protein
VLSELRHGVTGVLFPLLNVFEMLWCIDSLEEKDPVDPSGQHEDLWGVVLPLDIRPQHLDGPGLDFGDRDVFHRGKRQPGWGVNSTLKLTKTWTKKRGTHRVGPITIGASRESTPPTLEVSKRLSEATPPQPGTLPLGH